MERIPYIFRVCCLLKDVHDSKLKKFPKNVKNASEEKGVKVTMDE